MPATPTSVEEANSQLDAWKKSMSPGDYSSSKKVNKVVNWLKVNDPGSAGLFDLEAGGGIGAQIQRGVEDPTPESMGTSTQSGLGFSGSMGVSGMSGNVNLQQIYDDAINTPEIKGLESELTTKKDALTKALAGINDNPFYSEATRTGRIDKLNEQAGNEISDIEDRLNMRKADAQLKVNIATQQYNIDDNNYKNNLAKLNLLISSGALLNASSQDIAQIALATGMSTDMVVGMQNQMKQNLINPQVITATDDAGNVTVSVIDGSTGSIISQNSLGNIGKSKKTSTTPTSNKFLTGALTILKEEDISTQMENAPEYMKSQVSEDKMLSFDESTQAYNRILSLVGGDTTMADAVFVQAWDSGGYTKWGF